MKRSLTVIEVVGPAGAGKSTLTQALCQQDGRIRAGAFPAVRDAKNALLLIPTLFSLYRDQSGRTVSFQQIVSMIILSGWHRQLKAGSAKHEIVILDQGPIYLLAELLRFGPPNFRQVASKWWETTCGEWVNLLDTIVCLDTSDTILMERIRARGKGHGIKEHSDRWAVQFLAQYRNAQREVFRSLSDRQNHPKIIIIDSSTVSLSKTVETVLSLLNS
jgi:deoxyadenosine/deoxycytidine kinase